MALDEMDHDYRHRSGREVIEDTIHDQIKAKEQEIEAKEQEITAKEQEIRELREEIRERAEQIRERAEQIRERAEQIRGVEKEIAIASGTEVRLPLEVKLQFLRQETSSRDQQIIILYQQISSRDQQISRRDQQISSRDQQISILRQEIISIRSVQEASASAGNLTWTEWLNQQLPPLHLSFSTPPGLLQANDEITPASTIRWDLWPDVDQYIADAVTKSSRHKRIDIEDYIESRKEASSEADCCYVYQTLLVSIGHVLLGDKFRVSEEEWSRSSSLRQQRTTADTSRGALNDPSPDLNNVIELARKNLDSVLKVDILLKRAGRVFLVVEMKRLSFFRGTVVQNPPDLVEAYEGKDRRFLDGERYHVLAQSITQLFRYLVKHKIGYGIISSADLSYLVSRVGDSLSISEGIGWRHPKFVAALAYFMEKAADDTTPHEWKGGNGDKRSQDCDIDGSEETENTLSNHEEHDAPKNLKMTRTDRSVTRSMTGVSGLKETPAAHLHLEALPFATGWSGNIVRGTYEGHAVAVKLTMVGSSRAEALIYEASAYLKLQKYWGKYVPALISHGTTADGNVVYVATELIKGFELGMGGLPPEVVTASFEALNAIHAVGMLHGDIRLENILVPKGGQRGVRFIDFGFARSIASAEDCRKELGQLQDIVNQWHYQRSNRIASTADSCKI